MVKKGAMIRAFRPFSKKNHQFSLAFLFQPGTP
jgi:hypothetical protein